MNFAKRRLSSRTSVTSTSSATDNNNNNPGNVGSAAVTHDPYAHLPESGPAPDMDNSNKDNTSATTSSSGPQLILTKMRDSSSTSNSGAAAFERRRSSLIVKPNFYPAEVEQIRAQFHNEQTVGTMAGVLSSLITPLAAESSVPPGGYRTSSSSSLPFQYHGKHEEAMQKFRFNDRDLSALLSDDKSFLALQLSLRRKGAVTNALLLQGLPFFIMKNRKILLERVERDEKRRQEAEEKARLELEAQRCREEAGILGSEHEQDIAQRANAIVLQEEGQEIVADKNSNSGDVPVQQRIASLDLGDFDELESRWAQRDVSRSTVPTPTTTSS